jgi:hypothetical protein
MASSINKKRSEKIKKVPAAPANEVNPLSRVEAHCWDACCCIWERSLRIKHSKLGVMGWKQAEEIP